MSPIYCYCRLGITLWPLVAFHFLSEMEVKGQFWAIGEVSILVSGDVCTSLSRIEMLVAIVPSRMYSEATKKFTPPHSLVSKTLQKNKISERLL